MKRAVRLFSILILGVATAAADENTRNVQRELKDQGFYYGTIDGKSTPELSAAIRRYQIRNGLEVSGELNKETQESLGGGTRDPSVTKRAPEPPQTAAPLRPFEPAAEAKPRPPVSLRRDEDVRESDRRALEEDAVRPVAPPRDTIPPPAPLDGNPLESNPRGAYADYFAGTPYAIAPRIVQESAMRRAQQALSDRGYYHEEIDGSPGPATEEALLTYQRVARLPLTGRLDLQTLAALRLLPGRGVGNPPLRPFMAPSGAGTHPVYRGVWID